MSVMRTSIHGRRFGLGARDQLVSNEVSITTNAVDASITIAASQTSPRTVVIQLKNSDGTPIAHCQEFDIGIYLDAAGVAQAVTGGSTGLAADATAGYIEATVLAKKFFNCRTDATGKWSGTWTDTAHEVAFLGVLLPSGLTVFSGALTTA